METGGLLSGRELARPSHAWEEWSTGQDIFRGKFCGSSRVNSLTRTSQRVQRSAARDNAQLILAEYVNGCERMGGPGAVSFSPSNLSLLSNSFPLKDFPYI